MTNEPSKQSTHGYNGKKAVLRRDRPPWQLWKANKKAFVFFFSSTSCLSRKRTRGESAISCHSVGFRCFLSTQYMYITALICSSSLATFSVPHLLCIVPSKIFVDPMHLFRLPSQQIHRKVWTKKPKTNHLCLFHLNFVCCLHCIFMTLRPIKNFQTSKPKIFHNKIPYKLN